MRAFALTLLALLATLLMSGAMPNVDCSRPFLFSDAQINVIVLPYSNLAEDSPDLRLASSQLTLLLQQTILLSSRKYLKVGTVRMVASSPDHAGDCEASVVESKILGQSPGAVRQLTADGIAILLWGRIYKEGQDLYLSSFIKIVTRKDHPALETTADGRGVFTARLPGYASSFAPRLISTGLLQTIASSFRQLATVHQERRIDSPGFDPIMNPNYAPPYYVTETTNDGWMRVDLSNGLAGWIHADDSRPQRALSDKLPEVKFIDGAVGYLEFAKAENQNQIRVLAQPPLESFIEAAGTENTNLAIGIAKSMLAVMFKPNPQLRSHGYQLTREAVNLLPYSADARNLELVYRLDSFNNEIFKANRWRDVAAEFAQVAALGRGKQYIIDNFDSFYRACLRVPELINETDASQIHRQLIKLAALREVLPAPTSTNREERAATGIEPGPATPITTQADVEKRYFAGIEVGSKGIKAILFSFVRATEGSDEVITYGRTINSKLFSSTKDGNFTEAGVDEATSATKMLVDEMKALATTKGYGNIDFFIVGSVGVAKAMNKELLRSAIRAATGIDMEFIDATREGYFGLVSAIPLRRRNVSIDVDIGSGNTQLGCLVGAADFGSFHDVEIPFGSVSARKTANKLNPIDINLGLKELLSETVKPAYDRESLDVPCLKNRQRIYWTGGAGWATASFTHPERALDPYVAITERDLDKFLSELKDGSWNQKSLNYVFGHDVPLDRQKKIRLKAEKDRDDVTDVFVREDLLAGVSIMKTILESSNPSAILQFARSRNFLFGYAMQKFNVDLDTSHEKR